LKKKYWENKEIWIKDYFIVLGTNKKIITEYEQIQEKESVADKT